MIETASERMPALQATSMSEAQLKAAQALVAGPRKGVKGPFIPLLRSPVLMDRLQKVGEYLRFESALKPRIGEFIMLVVSRHWTQQFEWAVHVPLGRQAGLSEATIGALAEGRRPHSTAKDEEIAYDFLDELLRTRGVSDATYARAIAHFGENGVIDMLGVAGYFTTMSMVMNVARTPAEPGEIPALRPFPL